MYLLDYIDNNLLLLASVWYASFCLEPLFLWSRWMIEEGYFSQEITNEPIQDYRSILCILRHFPFFLAYLFLIELWKNFSSTNTILFSSIGSLIGLEALFLFSFSYLELSLSILSLRHMFIRMIDISWWM